MKRTNTIKTKTDLDRFVDTQKTYMDSVKKDLVSGKKQNHWIWFTFPQLRGVGKSQVSYFFGLKDLDHAKRYYDNKFLRKNLHKCFKIVMRYKNYNDLVGYFGTNDAKKIYRCASLFYVVTEKPIFKKFVDKFFDGLLDSQTVLLLS